MKNKVIWLSLSFLLVAAMLLASCARSTTAPTSTSTSKLTTTTSTTKTTSTIITTTATTKTTTIATTTTVTGNWWDKLGKPQYGGTMTIRINNNIANFDPYFATGTTNIFSAWMERLTTDNWTTDPAVFDFKIPYHPDEFVVGCLAQSWEFTNSSTIVYHLRKGVYWQNISPSNGREFIADDVVFNFDRRYGLGAGFTKPSPYNADGGVFQYLTSVTAIDNYTVAFNWKIPNPEFILQTLQEVVDNALCLANPEAVKLWGDLSDWHHAIGTGPFILKDVVSNSSATLGKNPNYWGYDERYPKNKLPYVDTIKYLTIPDSATAMAAMRTGKIDVMDAVALQDALAMQKTNPEISQISVSQFGGSTIDPRNDVAPFKDIRVREALQMAINLPEIATSYYSGTTDPWPLSLTSDYMPGWGFPYTQWPQDLKDQYAYNPTAAKKLLADAGFSTGFKTDIVAQDTVDFSLLQIIKSYFAAIGVDMEIRKMDSPSFTTFVKTNHQQDALAVRPSSFLGISYEPTRQLVVFATGVVSNYVNVSDPVFDAFSPKGMAATTVDQLKQVIRDENEYVARQHYVIALVQSPLFFSVQPWLKGYTGQWAAITGTSNGGPTLLFCYAARFWIDKSSK